MTAGRGEPPGPSASEIPAQVDGDRALADVFERGNAVDRVVFTFDGPLPGYEVGFVDEVVHAGSAETGEGEPVDAAGDAAIEVVLSPATATGEGGLAIPPHQQAQRPRLPALDEVAFAAEFDDATTFALGVSDRASASVTNGCNTWSSRFCPGSDVTRGQMASFLARAMDLTDPVRLVLEAGDEGDDVEQLQRRLANLDYFVGPIDGIYGDLTEQAVTAFQKLHELSRDGIVGLNVRERLTNPRPFYPQTSSGTWMELDETRQILVRVVNGNVREIFNTSSGTEEPYTYNGQQSLGDTPNGRHEFIRQIDGWRTSHLGRLYRPKYFTTGGHAVHGSTNVPPIPRRTAACA